MDLNATSKDSHSASVGNGWPATPPFRFAASESVRCSSLRLWCWRCWSALWCLVDGGTVGMWWFIGPAAAVKTSIEPWRVTGNPTEIDTRSNDVYYTVSGVFTLSCLSQSTSNQINLIHLSTIKECTHGFTHKQNRHIHAYSRQAG